MKENGSISFKELPELSQRIAETFPTWMEMLGPNRLVQSHHEIATIKSDQGQAKLCIAINGSALFVLTDRQHPMNPGRKAIYVLPLTPLLLAMASHAILGGDTIMPLPDSPIIKPGKN